MQGGSITSQTSLTVAKDRVLHTQDQGGCKVTVFTIRMATLYPVLLPF